MILHKSKIALPAPTSEGMPSMYVVAIDTQRRTHIAYYDYKIMKWKCVSYQDGSGRTYNPPSEIEEWGTIYK